MGTRTPGRKDIASEQAVWKPACWPALGLVMLLAACASPDDDCLDGPDCLGVSYPTEAHLFDALPQGEAQLESLCARLAERGVQSAVRDAFCTNPRPAILSSQELLTALGLPFDGPSGKDAQRLGNGNPAWSVVGHSAGLSRRTISPVNPRVIVHTPTPTHLAPVPGFVVVTFSRGEGFAEIITHDPERDDLDFFLFKYQYPCADPNHCTEAERFGAQHEFNWPSYTIYGEEDLENTVLDCLQCHKTGLRHEGPPKKSLLMFQLNSMWMHWMYDHRHFENWTDNPAGPGPFHDALQRYVTAHATTEEPLGETYGGIPDGSLYSSRPKSLEDLIEGNGYGNGFDATAYNPDGAAIGLLEDNRAEGMFFRHSWEELYEMNLNGLLIAPPGRGETPFDPYKLEYLTAHYQAYRNGETELFPNVHDLFEDENLSAVGLRLQPNLSVPEMLIQGCSQCHHDQLNPALSRANFQLGPREPGGALDGAGDYMASQTSDKLWEIRERINLPDDHLKGMPPFRFRTLSEQERAAITLWLDTVSAGLTMIDDGQAPQPTQAIFELLPGPVPEEGPYYFTSNMNEAAMPEFVPSMALMRARPGSDPTGYVEYYFEETSGNAGATSSGWQLSPRYLDTGLVYGETYSYRVKMRDRAGNQGAFSEEHSFELIQVLELCPEVDQDSDCDTVPNAEELDEDTDGDGIPNVLDTDDDGDSFSTKNEKEDGLIWGIDNDQDGKPTWVDMDSDGDSYSDYLEGGGDNNFNQIPGYLDPDEPCGDGACASEQGELHENCSTCPADCSCPAGSSCVEATCKEG